MKKIISFVLTAVMSAMVMAGCSGQTNTSGQSQSASSVASSVSQSETASSASQTNVQTQYPITLTDQVGNEVVIEHQPERIVSGYYISSSACLALGLKDHLVAVEEKIQQRPIYQYAAADIMDSLGNVGSAKAFDLETCLNSDPDLVILPKKAKDYAQTLAEMGIPTLVVNPENQDQLVEMITLLGQATNENEKADELIAAYEKIENKVTELTANLSDEEKPVVYMCGTDSYLSTSPKDMYQASLIRLAGGKNAGDIFEGDSRVEVSYEQLLQMNPDVMIIPTNNMANGQPDYTAAEILADSNLAEVTAVKNGAVYNMPTGYEAWDSPVPSSVLGMLWMVVTLHPDLYSMDEFANDAAEFYKTFYNIEIDKTQLTGQA